jgi:F420H(2)-dependent quinone reductase
MAVSRRRRKAVGLVPKVTVALDRTFGRWIYPLHRRLYLRTGGAVGLRSPLGPILLLTTTGRKTGQPRTTPLLYLPDGDAFIVVASNAGRPDPPNWLRNLERSPEAAVQVGRRKVAVKARILDGPEAAELWPRLDRHYAGWRHYATLSGRPIPPVVLSPLD